MSCLGLCAVLASCKDLLKDTVCVVDAARARFQCVNDDFPHGFSFSFQEAKTLVCVAPQDVEAILKSCKAHKIILVPECTFDGQSGFVCGGSPVEARLVDNYFCLFPKGWERFKQRCF